MSSTQGTWNRGMLLGWLSRNGHSRLAMPTTLLSEKAFRSEFIRERARSERNGSAFVILQLNLKSNSEPGDSHALHTLCNVVVARSRCSDVVGLHEDGIGLLLPDTTQDVVAGLVSSIERLLHARLRQQWGTACSPPDLKCKVYFWTPQTSHLQGDENMRGSNQ